jgi:hypothetical protein
MYDHDIIHFDKAEQIYASRGWRSKGERYDRKRLCDGTHLYYDEDSAVYYIQYQGDRIITILRNHGFLLHRPRGWCAPGLMYRLNAFLPAQLTAHRGTLYCGKTMVTGDHQISLHDAYSQPYYYWRNASCAIDASVKTPLVIRELFERILAGYFYNYFSAYSQVAYKTIKLTPKLNLNFRTQNNAGTNVTDSFLTDENSSICRTVDEEGWWMQHAYDSDKPQPVSVIMQALAYLMEYRFNVTPDSMLHLDAESPWKYPEYLRTFEHHKEFPGYTRNAWRHRAGNNPYKDQIVLFNTARAALGDLMQLMYHGHSDKYFTHRAAIPALTSPNNHDPNRFRAIPYGSSVDELDPFTYHPNSDGVLANGAKVHMNFDTWMQEHNSYFPRTILFSILDYYARTKQYPKAWLDSVCERAFTQPSESSTFGGVQNPLETGHPETPPDAHDILVASRFAPLYVIMRKFFLDRFAKLSHCIKLRDFELAWGAADYYYAARGYLSPSANNRNVGVLPHTSIRDGISPAPSLNDPRYMTPEELL